MPKLHEISTKPTPGLVMGNRRIKTVRYRASTVEEAELRYQSDAALYMRTGWAIAALGWDYVADRPTLVTTYARPETSDMLGTALGIWAAFHVMLILLGLR